MKNTVMDIDISKDKIDYCLINSESHQVIQRGEVVNDRKELLKFLNKIDFQQTSFAMEHTGHYGAMLSWVLSEKKAFYYLLNPLELKRSLGVHRGKTDAIDAYRIANYAIKNSHALKAFELPCENLRKLKAMVSTKHQIVKISIQLQNSIKANVILSKTLDIKRMIKEQKAQLKSVKKLINSLAEQMQAVIDSCEQLKKSYRKITQVIGVGPLTAIKCISETDNFTRFINARKFSCHCGLAPFPYQSGSSIKGRTRTHYLKNAALKSILFKAATSAIQHDPQLRNYYNRKLDEGKHKLSVLNAVANKIVLRIFAVVNRDETFIKLNA